MGSFTRSHLISHGRPTRKDHFPEERLHLKHWLSRRSIFAQGHRHHLPCRYSCTGRNHSTVLGAPVHHHHRGRIQLRHPANQRVRGCPRGRASSSWRILPGYLNFHAVHMACQDAGFVRHAKDEYAKKWKHGATVSLKEYMASGLTKYKTLKMKGLSQAPSPEQEQIIALTARSHLIEGQSRQTGKTTGSRHRKGHNGY
jgi:hypothetical protein